MLLMAGATVAIVGALTLTLGLAAVSKGFRFSTFSSILAATAFKSFSSDLSSFRIDDISDRGLDTCGGPIWTCWFKSFSSDMSSARIDDISDRSCNAKKKKPKKSMATAVVALFGMTIASFAPIVQRVNE